MIIAVDFDGTLHLGHYPEIGIQAPDAVKIMRRLKDEGHYIIINTCRSGELLVEAINWLLSHDVPFDRVNDNEPGNTAKYGSNSRKVFADIYVDDRQVGGLPPWEEVYGFVKRKENDG